MADLSASQLQIITALIDTAPDAAIRSLDMALASEAGTDGPMAAIRDMVSAEAAERRARRITFVPLSGMCASSGGDAGRKAFPRQTIGLLWKALKSDLPDQVALAIASLMQSTEDDNDGPVFNDLCAAAAAGLRNPDQSPYAAAAVALDEAMPGATGEIAKVLDLAPLSRQSMSRLTDWVSRMTEERAAAVRLAYRDATSISPDGGPRLLEVLAARLDEPWLILRLIAVVHEKPSDKFLHGSELRELCERILADVDHALDNFAAFDPAGGAEAGIAAATDLTRAITEIAEFEQTIDLRKDGPWGARILKQKALLNKKAEIAMRKVDDAVGAALPVKAPRYGRGLRGIPVFDHAPDPAAIARAEAMLTFLQRSRGPAQMGGFSSLRTKVVEHVDDRVDHYVDDVLDNLRSEMPEEPTRAAEFLEIAARLVGLFRDDKAAQIVRRRAAA